MKKILSAIIILAAAGFILSKSGIAPASENSAASADAAKSPGQKFHVLIVPGHEPDNGGTNFEDVYERNLVVPLADDLQAFLDADGKYETSITRDTASWNPTFAAYFQNNWNAIISWEQNAKNSFAASSSALGNAAGEIHNDAAEDDALRLYGIVKWADENGVDLMVHIHLNNYPGSPAHAPGKYSGLVMYMPDPVLQNASATAPIAAALFKRLTLYNPVSDLPVESAGLETDPDLIALGAYDTSKAPSVLIEYDYIYQPQFTNPSVRPIALDDYAYQTYLGIEDYLSSTTPSSAAASYDPVLVYDWKNPVSGPASDPRDIYAMQTALLLDGDFPPKGKSGNDCPHGGVFGACTASALSEFEGKRGLTGGADNPDVFAALQAVYRQNHGSAND